MRTAFFALAILFAAVTAAPPARAAVMLSVPPTATTPAIPVYVAQPPGKGPFPTVLLLHGCGGMDGFLAVAADRLTFRGYAGVALDALGPHGMRTACDSNSDGDEAGAARATLAWLRTQSWVAADRLGIVGFSMGADAALALIDTKGAAPIPGLRGAAIYYPSCEGRDGLVNVPLTIFDGSADTVAPPAPCEAMVRAGAAAGKTETITTYPGATHGFDVPGPDRMFYGQKIHYDAAAAGDAARKAFDFIVRYLGPGVTP